MNLLLIALCFVAFIGWVAFYVLSIKFLSKLLFPIAGRSTVIVAAFAFPAIFFGTVYVLMHTLGLSAVNWFFAIVGIIVTIIGALSFKHPEWWR